MVACFGHRTPASRLESAIVGSWMSGKRILQWDRNTNIVGSTSRGNISPTIRQKSVISPFVRFDSFWFAYLANSWRCTGRMCGLHVVRWERLRWREHARQITNISDFFPSGDYSFGLLPSATVAAPYCDQLLIADVVVAICTRSSPWPTSALPFCFVAFVQFDIVLLFTQNI